jgi:hypothetical protein
VWWARLRLLRRGCGRWARRSPEPGGVRAFHCSASWREAEHGRVGPGPAQDEPERRFDVAFSRNVGLSRRHGGGRRAFACGRTVFNRPVAVVVCGSAVFVRPAAAFARGATAFTLPTAASTRGTPALRPRCASSARPTATSSRDAGVSPRGAGISPCPPQACRRDTAARTPAHRSRPRPPHLQPSAPRSPPPAHQNLADPGQSQAATRNSPSPHTRLSGAGVSDVGASFQFKLNMNSRLDLGHASR